MRIAINGFGRIGRCIVRVLLERNWPDALELVAINDPGSARALVHLLNHDSVHGKLTAHAVLNDDGSIAIGDKRIPLLAIADTAQLPWRELGVDFVFECSGRLRKHEKVQQHIDAGAQRALVAAPMPDADFTVVYGVNHRALTPAHRILSNASCTTNCLAPVAMILQREFGIIGGQMTTIHAYTNDQHLVDTAVDDLYRGRAGAMSMIPTKTGAAEAVGLVLPELAGRFSGMAVRVPTPDVSIVDLHCILEKTATREAINAVMADAAAGALRGVLAYNEEPLVSVDFCHNPASSIFDAMHTRVLGAQTKVMAWYDNEWGFSQRMVDVALYLQNI